MDTRCDSHVLKIRAVNRRNNNPPQGKGLGMTESGVQVIVMKAFENYEEKTGKPRHEQNLRNFAKLFDINSRQNGGINVLKWMLGIFLGIPALVWTIMQIARAVKGH